MWIGDFHPVDLDEDEVIKFVGHHACIELRNNFADRSSLPSSGRTRDIDTRAGAIRDSGFQMSIDCGEFIVSAGKDIGDGGDMEVRASDLEGGRIDMIRREYAGSKRREFEGPFAYDAILTLVESQLILEEWLYRLWVGVVIF